ncbi:hypothetical protein M758_10G107100 [Ceratodon purpureus]|uniref:RING-CH-type domain-containing protein n=1 Tax=Ceratodon purpureus TaxID=3225 RepID=A0A8T0GJ64_CERPU|nr:hypothetical protein KC19_10G110800 [Ceratodon purpureus]KAG0603607.1 hypothetical protein M758_10G107100 [Ceratodon purpureus]
MSARGEGEDSSDIVESSRDTEPLLPVEHLKDKNHTSPNERSTMPLEDVLLVQIHRAGTSKDGEIDALMSDPPQCRICLDSEGDEELIAPCRCKGTQKYVHRSCLDHWRAVKEGFAFAHCTECRTMFHLRANMPAERWWLRLKFKLLVIRDHAALFIVVQLVVASMAMLVYSLYGEQLIEMFGYEQYPIGFYPLAISVSVLVGLLYGFFIAIICGQRINNRHYHVLAKQELTKEYVVENLNEGEEAPPLDRAHVSELQMLGLYHDKDDLPES